MKTSSLVITLLLASTNAIQLKNHADTSAVGRWAVVPLPGQVYVDTKKQEKETEEETESKDEKPKDAKTKKDED